ncbi:Bifunctional ligase/repressor BirA [compost metagenome]
MMNKHEQLLRLLLDSEGSDISGEDISRQLNISRTAVWKHVNKLRKLGYEIDASPRLGYRLSRRPEWLQQEELAAAIDTRRFGQELRVLMTTASTQQVAMELAESGMAEGLTVLAEEQTGGRGRFGRKWFSPPGKGIWMSIILRPQQPLQYTSQLTLLTGVAVCRAIRQCTGVQAEIKWPNDLLVNGRKLCGILLESAVEDQRLRYCIAGIGIDVNMETDDYPEELKKLATSLRLESGKVINRTELIAAILSELESLYDLYAEQGFTPIASLWEALSASIGRRIRSVIRGETVEGTAMGLDTSGALLLRLDDGQVVPVFSGEIELKP